MNDFTFCYLDNKIDKESDINNRSEMFENFVIFTEVVKLSQNIFYQQRQINYSSNIFHFTRLIHNDKFLSNL